MTREQLVKAIAGACLGAAALSVFGIALFAPAPVAVLALVAVMLAAVGGSELL